MMAVRSPPAGHVAEARPGDGRARRRLLPDGVPAAAPGGACYRPMVTSPHTASPATASVTAAPNTVSHNGLR